MRKLALAAAALIGLSVPASAEAGIKIGMLTCQIEGGIGYIIASSKEVECIYRAGGGRRELYAGSLGKLGVDIGVTTAGALVWAVFAPGRAGPGGLEGYYAGASAEATVAVGLGANVLIGGFRHTINLQPVSVQGQAGLNVAAGLGGLHLEYVEPVTK